MLAEKKAEFVRLFQEFVSSYPYTPDGLRHRAAYDEQRQQGRRNFEAIASAAESGKDVTESVIWQLLPYEDSHTNRQKGAWVHINPCTTQGLLWTSKLSKDLSLITPVRISQLIIYLVCCCNDDPSQLSSACRNFSEEMPASLFGEIGILTPILNALRPDDFLAINHKSIQVINYFANTSYSKKLIDYSSANFTGHELIEELTKEMHQNGAPSIRDDDLFDMFCHWLVEIKKYDFPCNEVPLVDEEIVFEYAVEEVKLQPEYSLNQCAEETGFQTTQLAQWIHTINRKGQTIIQGPPGTGKTFLAQKLAQHLIGGGDGFSDIIQFHPAYTYEDFIEGLRPITQNGQLTYSIVPGRFLEFCKKAEAREDTCVLIIDEINRANLSQVFGELMYLLDDRQDTKRFITLASGQKFRIPTNVRIIGTMNTADRSIALVDQALRRRFAFISLSPNYELLQNYHSREETGFPVDKLIRILENVNRAINNKHYELGISFFLTKTLAGDIQDIWKMEIEPYLEEYFFDNQEKMDEFLWDNVALLILW
ncbi:AAA family ATPase [Microcoleus sp. bin38.metabat.b11b12b14.051]|uniref:McrB family protein n=1 Tax=Microcoleus sp. bin38.metabat.b11b12b14.051 TaxID=2742709 RepID=UPI0025D80AD4|nr:AAA family ATPase [Microcoleus sp. bin38.metabat.b11b12b14.051]